MVGIQGGMVNDLYPEISSQPFQCSSSRIIIIEIALYLAINAQHFQCFLQIGNGIKDKPVRSDDAHLHSGEVIHKALEYGAHVRTVTLQGNVLRRDAALEKAITQFHSSCLITKADGIVPFAMHPVSNLLAVWDGNVGIDASFFQVAQQFGVLQWSHPNVLEDEFFLHFSLRLLQNR